MKKLNFVLGTLNLFRRWDKRLVIFVALAAAGALTIAGSLVLSSVQTNLRMQFGDPRNWPEHTSEVNNMTFRYPSGMEIIVPEDQTKNPVSVVKKGERGESVLMQIGTWRDSASFQGLGETTTRYEAASKRRTTLRTEDLFIDGRAGKVFVQDEGDRRIWEAFLWDEKEARELSLQLPGSASEQDRILYARAFQELLKSVRFVSVVRPKEIPADWQREERTNAGFSVWRPADWKVAEEFEENGIRSTIFQPETETTNDTPPDTGLETAYIIHALQKDQRVSVSDLDERFVKSFRATAIEGTLKEEHFGFPGVGVGISLEARQPNVGREGATLVMLAVLVAAETTPQGDATVANPLGRGYMISAIFNDEKYIDQARTMTKSLRLLSQ